jgi:hypothetical protein
MVLDPAHCLSRTVVEQPAEHLSHVVRGTIIVLMVHN